MPLFSTLVPLSGTLPSGTERLSIPDGYAGTAATISHMQKMVSYGKRQRDVRALALKLIGSCSSKDFSCYARAIYEYVSGLKYVFDPVGIEALVSPLEVIKMGGGDCDDLAMLISALLEVVGIRAEYETLRADPSKPDEFTHVYVRARVPGKGWVYLDPTMPDKGYGWRPPVLYGVKDWPSSLDAPEDHGDDTMKGLSAIMDCGALCAKRTPSRLGALAGEAEDGMALYYMLRSKGADKTNGAEMLQIANALSNSQWYEANAYATSLAERFFRQPAATIIANIPSQVIIAEDPIGALQVVRPPPDKPPVQNFRPAVSAGSGAGAESILSQIPWYLALGVGALAYVAFSGGKKKR